MTILIKILQDNGSFAEDKDEARRIRVTSILPALKAGENITLDFSGVKYATQSFIHALIGEALKQFEEEVLEKIEFQNCSAQVKNIIGLVVDYSLGGFKDPQSSNNSET